MTYEKPLPRITKEDRPFWEAAKRHVLVLPKCRGCGHVSFPPYVACSKCLSFERDWIEASGRGKVWGYIEMRQPYIKSFEDDLPYNVVLVELEEGPFMYSNVTGIPSDEIKPDLPLEAYFEDVTNEITLIKFRPRQE